MRTPALVLVVALTVLGKGPAHAQSRDFATYALFGGDKLKIGSRSRLVTGDVGSNGTVVIGARATLHFQVDVAGDVISARRQSSWRATATITSCAPRARASSARNTRASLSR